MKATKRRIYLEHQDSEQNRAGTIPDWAVSVDCHRWWCTKDDTCEHVVQLNWYEGGEWHHERRLLECETDAQAVRATQRLFGERLQALAGEQHVLSCEEQNKIDAFYVEEVA